VLPACPMKVNDVAGPVRMNDDMEIPRSLPFATPSGTEIESQVTMTALEGNRGESRFPNLAGVHR